MKIYVERTQFTDDVFLKKDNNNEYNSYMMHCVYDTWVELTNGEIKLEKGEVKEVEIGEALCAKE